MKPSTGSSRPRRLELGALITCAFAALACVSSGTHQQVVEERDALAKDVARLQVENASLDKERVSVIGEVEELSQQKEKLDASVAELSARKEELEIDLAKSERSLAQRNQEVQQLRSTYDGLVADLQTEVAAGRVQIEQLRDGLHVKLAQEILFPSGSAELSREGEGVLGKVAGRLREVDQRIEVQGHTDNQPISGKLAARYPSNWELAGARAAVVVRLMAKQGVPATRLTATSYADTLPVASNDTADGRARNRRIEIRLVPKPAAGAAAQGA
jgi:chemotaxis protein MotB